jgi:hypothetical protein
MKKSISVNRFGKDHWSLLAYIECLCVDNGGIPDLRRMRVNARTHPDLAHSNMQMPDPKVSGVYAYPTRLRGGTVAKEHDDHDCADDLELAGFIIIKGTGIAPYYELTEKGWGASHRLRKFKGSGGSFTTFQYKE